ncbi:T9SS type A sorting domain-containing protein [Candidatus Neomarinimicrobiota bacterium]
MKRNSVLIGRGGTVQCRRDLTILLAILALNWLPLALFAQGDFWQQIQGPPGGTITALAISDSGVIYAGTEYSGVFRSTDNGENWMQSGLPGREIDAIAVSPGGDVFASSREQFTPVGLYRSADDGQSWTLIGLTDVEIRCIAINDSGHIFAGTNGNGVYRSTDNGTTWAVVNAFLYDHNVYALAINDSGYIFAGTFHELFLSKDNGGTWIPTGLGSYIPDPPIGVSSIAINDSGHVFIGCRAKGIYRSISDGESWDLVGLAGESIYAVVIASNDHIFTGTWEGGVFHSADNGETWTGLPPEQPIYCLVANSSNYIFAAVGGLGLYRSADQGAGWTPVINGLVSTRVKLLGINAAGEIFTSTAFNFFRSTDGGESWDWAISGLPLESVQSICFSPDGYIFIGQSGIFRSGDNGDSWRQVHLDGALSLTSNSEGHIFAATGSIIRSIDHGATWVDINDDIDGKLVKIDSAGNVFAMGGGPEGSTHWKSSDNGENWVRVPLDTGVHAVGLDLHYLYAGGDHGGIYRSGDGGDTWTAFDIGLTQSAVKSLIVNHEGTVFAGTYGGIFASADNGETWTRLDSGLSHTANGVLALAPEGYLYGGTDGGGVYRSVQPTLSVREFHSMLPTSLTLGQNYPNPFNPTTVISYILPAAQTVTLKVYDVLGREVATLVDGPQAAGDHQSAFDGSQLPSGIYLYRLAAGSYVQSRKMLLLK